MGAIGGLLSAAGRLRVPLTAGYVLLYGVYLVLVDCLSATAVTDAALGDGPVADTARLWLDMGPTGQLAATTALALFLGEIFVDLLPEEVSIGVPRALHIGPDGAKKAPADAVVSLDVLGLDATSAESLAEQAAARLNLASNKATPMLALLTSSTVEFQRLSGMIHHRRVLATATLAPLAAAVGRWHLWLALLLLGAAGVVALHGRYLAAKLRHAEESARTGIDELLEIPDIVAPAIQTLEREQAREAARNEARAALLVSAGPTDTHFRFQNFSAVPVVYRGMVPQTSVLDGSIASLAAPMELMPKASGETQAISHNGVNAADWVVLLQFTDETGEVVGLSPEAGKIGLPLKVAPASGTSP